MEGLHLVRGVEGGAVMQFQKVTITPLVDLASGTISLQEFIEEPDLFNPRELFKRHAIQVVQTRDKAVRAALIALGWRPPADQGQMPDLGVREHVRAQDPGTSIAAAEKARGAARRHCEAIVNALDLHGDMTVREIGAKVGLTHVQVARRMPDLQRAGLAEVVQTPGGDDLERGGCRVWRRANRELATIAAPVSKESASP